MRLPKDTHTVFWEDGALRLIDQRVLPERFEVLRLTDYRQVADAIRTMAVRGAPAIGVTAAFGLALAAREALLTGGAECGPFRAGLHRAADELRDTRPTAVNLFWAIDRILRVAGIVEPPEAAAAVVLDEAQRMAEEDVRANRALGAFGAALLLEARNILTHCNTGSLATVHFGTALGVVRSMHELGQPVHVWVDETRPRLQGMKLTAWECRELGIPATLITDSMAASLMRAGQVDAAIVGADRIAANGDTANKIGTYSLAVLCRAHNLPFYVAAPLSTVDFAVTDGTHIPIEQRRREEVTHAGGAQLAPDGIADLNPAFDVTPADLITAIITENGVAHPPFTETLAALR
jgi:methylthioribose-1-phosphate isomerase